MALQKYSIQNYIINMTYTG